MTIQVLVVDEDEDVLDITSTFLDRHEDLAISTELDPNRAAERVIAGEFGAVVSDLSMQNIDGLELCQRIREAGSDVPFLLFTGSEKGSVPDRPETGGVTAFVRKGAGTGQYDTLAEHIRTEVA